MTEKIGLNRNFLRRIFAKDVYLPVFDLPPFKEIRHFLFWDGRLNLSNLGWTAYSIKSGEHVTVTGNPTHSGLERIAFKRLARADGTELLPAGTQRSQTLEEEPHLVFARRVHKRPRLRLQTESKIL